jgi:rhodanese-related sulfurtransferase/rubrerythrin
MESLKVGDVTAAELKNYMEDRQEKSYLLVDVREPKEYRMGHIPGAVLLPLKEVEAGITGLADADRDLFFYCRSGRRSKIAANLVADLGVPARKIYNVSGGILAWQGKRLPDFPRLHHFDAAGDVLTILQKALELEKGTGIFYTVCAGLLEDKDISAKARALADFETVHAKVIYRCMKRLKPDLEEFEKMFERASGEIMEGGLSVHDAVKGLAAMEEEPCINFAEMALEIEFTAYDLYRNLATKAEDRESVGTLLMLSEQEKGHIRIVANILSACLKEG